MSKQKFIRASYDAPTRSVQYETDDGRILVRSGGSLCWRTNNCGNLSSPVDTKNNKPKPVHTKSWIGFAEVNNPQQHFFFIFPSYEEGREQLKASLLRKYANFSLAETIDKYADKSDPTNDPARYLAFIRDKTGLESETVINNFSQTQLEALLDAIEGMEGYQASKETQKEQWLNVSRFSTSDGAAPIAGAQVHVEYNGSTFPVHADARGVLPPMAHASEGMPATKVKILKPDGSWKNLVELSHATQPKTGVLVLDMLVMTAQTLAHKAPMGTKGNKIPQHYRVQPGDSLNSVAQKFRTTAAEIQRLNHINGTQIHPEQMLWINGFGVEVNRTEARASTKKMAQAAIDAHAHKTKATVSEQSNFHATKPLVDAPVKRNSTFLEQLAKWVSPTPVQYARSKEGSGAPLALFDPGEKRAPWMAVAFKEAKDWAGKLEGEIQRTHNIHELVNQHADMSITPWCASFVNYCLKFSEPPYPMASRVLSSFSFAENPDRFSEIKKPIYGAIRFSLRKNGGHVCFVIGKLGDNLVVLGGNQNDQIKIEIPEPSTKKSERFFIPIAYKNFADKEQEKALSEVDVTALQTALGKAVSPGLRASISQN